MPGEAGEGRVHDHDRGPEPGHVVADVLGVVAGVGGGRKEAPQNARTGGGDLVEVQAPGCVGAEGALRHDGQHAGAGGRFENHVAGADGGGLDGGVGQRERGGELLQAQLFLGAAGLGGLQGRQGLQHAQHGGGDRRVRRRPRGAWRGRSAAGRGRGRLRPLRRRLSRARRPGRRWRRRRRSWRGAGWGRRGRGRPRGRAAGPGLPRRSRMRRSWRAGCREGRGRGGAWEVRRWTAPGWRRAWGRLRFGRGTDGLPWRWVNEALCPAGPDPTPRPGLSVSPGGSWRGCRGLRLWRRRDRAWAGKGEGV